MIPNLLLNGWFGLGWPDSTAWTTILYIYTFSIIGMVVAFFSASKIEENDPNF